MTPRIGSLCSGYGGLELGLMAAIGGSVAWHVEHDKHPSVVLETRFPGVPNYGDVTDTDWAQVEPVEVIAAGYPCQPFSTLGKRLGAADERHLWPHVAHAVGVLRPRLVFLENVAGHVSLGLDVVLGDLAALGYDAMWGVVRASDASACHERARVFIAASDTTGGGRGRSKRQQRRLGSAELLTTAAPDPHDSGRERIGDARGRRHGPPHDSEPASLPDHEQPSRQRVEQPRRAAAAGPGPCSGRGDDRRSEPACEWGAYQTAIDRWGRAIGRPAPRPTEPGRGRERLSPRFVEWMMGLPDGWVTDILPRSPALKCLGNGVVPQQAALAVRTLLNIGSVAA